VVRFLSKASGTRGAHCAAGTGSAARRTFYNMHHGNTLTNISNTVIISNLNY